MFNVGGGGSLLSCGRNKHIRRQFQRRIIQKNAIGSETGLMDESENLSVKKNHLSLFQSWFKLFRRVLVQWEQPCL